MTKLPQQINDSGLVRWMCDVVVSGFDLCLVDVTAQMLLLKCIYMIFWNKLSQKCFVSLLKNNLSPSSWAPKARSEAWEVYPWELYPPDDPPRPSRPKAGSGPSCTKYLTYQLSFCVWSTKANQVYNKSCIIQPNLLNKTCKGLECSDVPSTRKSNASKSKIQSLVLNLFVCQSLISKLCHLMTVPLVTQNS